MRLDSGLAHFLFRFRAVRSTGPCLCCFSHSFSGFVGDVSLGRFHPGTGFGGPFDAFESGAVLCPLFGGHHPSEVGLTHRFDRSHGGRVGSVPTLCHSTHFRPCFVCVLSSQIRLPDLLDVFKGTLHPQLSLPGLFDCFRRTLLPCLCFAVLFDCFRGHLSPQIDLTEFVASFQRVVPPKTHHTGLRGVFRRQGLALLGEAHPAASLTRLRCALPTPGLLARTAPVATLLKVVPPGATVPISAIQ